MKRLFLLVCFVLQAALPSIAATHTAASCTQAAFATAKAAAEADTDATVVLALPACSTGQAWTTAFTITAPSTATSFTFKGAGSDAIDGGNNQTVIVDNYMPQPANQFFTAGPLLTFVPNATGGAYRVYGITIQADATNSNYKLALINVVGTTTQFRFDHSTVNLLNGVYPAFNFAVTTAFENFGYVRGVIDHNIFNYPDRGGAFIVHFNGYGAGGEGDESWAAATQLGSNDFIYFEDNTITNLGNGGTVNDCYHAGKFVVRFNTIQGSGFAQTHPTGGSGRARGCRAWEAYQNTMTVGGNGSPQFNGFFMSSGTGVVWGNNAGSQVLSNFVTAHSMRANNTTYTQTATPNGWGYSGTAFNGTGSNWDENSIAATGWRVLDQPGRGVGDLLSGAFPNVTNVTRGCISSQTCAYTRQADEPVYEWLNTWSCVGCGGSFWSVFEPDQLQANRDYYLYTASFNGTSGVGAGTLAARPATCTTGVAYWATDQGSWNAGTNPVYTGQGQAFKCTATNTWTLYYTPYTYPHPLITSPSPFISSITPNSGTQGDMALAVSVVGAATSWSNGVTVASFSGSGITVNSTTVSSATTATLSIDIGAMATPGLRNLLMTTGADVETATNGFTVVDSAPPGTISSVTPSLSAQGTSPSLAIVGSGTSWVNGVTVGAFSGSGVTVNSTTVTSGTTATLSVTIANDATLGARNLTMTTTTDVETGLDAFTVTPRPPTQVTFTDQPATSAAEGASLGTIAVAIQDSDGNTVTSATSVVTLALCSALPAGTLTGSTSVAAVAGVATFIGVNVVDGTGIGYTLCATSPGLTGATSNAFEITDSPTPPPVPPPTPGGGPISGAPLSNPQQQFFNGPGLANVSGFVCTYAAGTLNPLLTYRDDSLTVANQNPIRLNAAGRPSFSGAEVQIYVQARAYKIVVYARGTGNRCNGVDVGAVISTRDNLRGFNMSNAVNLLVGGSVTANEQLISTAAQGRAPIVVTSTTPVTDLTVSPRSYSSAGTAKTGVSLVTGTVALTGGTASVTLTGSAAFSALGNYVCTATDETGAAAVRVVRVSASNFTLAGTTTNTIAYTCIGN